jgi:rare lipoprotein A (peptidoglycan hydrolase)
MRTLFVFCAIALGLGCDASATELGLASFYGAQGLTAAHRSLPMGSRVKVLNLDNGRSVIVRIVDRRPFIRGRIIDVSTAAAVTLGFPDAGLAHVRIAAFPRKPRRPAPGLRGRRRLRPTRPRPMRSAVTTPIAWSIF